MASAATAALALLPQAAAAATGIGQALDGVTCGAGTGMDTVQVASAGPSYSVPAGAWQVTAWSADASAQMDSTLQLEIWRPTATANTFTLVGISAPQTLLAASGVNTFPLVAPIPVQAADLLGLRVTGTAGCASYTGDYAGDIYRVAFGTAPRTAGTATIFANTKVGYELNVAATLEAAAPPPPPAPAAKSDCVDGGWQSLTDDQGVAFKNQGDCVSFVATHGRNSAAG
ncbi:MAG: hypothetical protein ABI838_08680 [Chloroflexota bacterium]